MKRLMLILAATVALAGVGVTLAPSPAVAAISVGNTCSYDPHLAGCHGGSLDRGSNPYLKTVLDTLLFAAGIVSFLFVLVGGIRYITATGDGPRIQKAKDTLLYAIIGLIITFLAAPIVGFVISKSGG